LHGWTYEGTHVEGAHGHDREPILFQKLGAFNYGTNGVCGSGAWGSYQLEDHTRLMNRQYAYVSTR